jgi:hypothetical protein
MPFSGSCPQKPNKTPVIIIVRRHRMPCIIYHAQSYHYNHQKPTITTTKQAKNTTNQKKPKKPNMTIFKKK